MRLVYTFCYTIILPNSIWQKGNFIELVKFFIKNVQLFKTMCYLCSVFQQSVSL